MTLAILIVIINGVIVWKMWWKPRLLAAESKNELNQCKLIDQVSSSEMSSVRGHLQMIFVHFSIIVTLRGGGGPGHDVKKKINFQK